MKKRPFTPGLIFWLPILSMHFSHVSETGRERAAGDVSASTSPLFKTRRSHGHGQLVGGLWTGVGPKGGPQLGDVAVI